MRDLVRGRDAAVTAVKRGRQQLLSFLLRQGRSFPGKTHWSKGHRHWLAGQTFEHAAHQILFHEQIEAVREAEARRDRLTGQIESLMAQRDRAPVVAALSAMRGIALIGAATLVTEIGDFRRFATPRQLMGYLGQVPSEVSSGKRVRRGGITRAGNARVRRILTEAAWTYLHKPRIGPALAKRHDELPKAPRDIAWKAQLRLSHRFRHLLAKGKRRPIAVTAVAREMIGFLWAIGCQAEPHAGSRRRRRGKDAHPTRRRPGPNGMHPHRLAQRRRRGTAGEPLSRPVSRSSIDARTQSEAAPRRTNGTALPNPRSEVVNRRLSRPAASPAQGDRLSSSRAPERKPC